MLDTVGIVQTCFETDRERANATRKLNGKTVLEWIVRRVTDCQQLDGVVVLTDDRTENQFVSDIIPADVPVFSSSRPDALSRFAAALEEFSADSAVRVRTDYPFVDPMLLDRLITTAQSHPSCDYASYCLRDGRPAILSPVGVCGEWFRSSALFRAARKATDIVDRRNVTQYLYTHPKKFNICLISAPNQIDRDDVRLTVRIEEDWDNVQTILDALGPDELDWQRIADLLDHQPALRERMAVLNRENDESQTPV